MDGAVFRFAGGALGARAYAIVAPITEASSAPGADAVAGAAG